VDQVTTLQNQVNQQQGQIDQLLDQDLKQQFQIDQLLDQAAPPTEIILEEGKRGRYEADGTALLGDNYFAGALDFFGANREFRNFFAFDLTLIFEKLNIYFPPPQGCQVTIVGGLFNVVNPRNGFVSNSNTETYSLNRAGLGDPTALMDGLAGPAGFTDLADGPGYGSFVASAAATGEGFIPLSPRAIRDMNVTLDSPPNKPGTNSRFFAIGGSISTLNDLVDTEGLFAGSSSTATASGLILEVKKTRFCP
jgi:hypothetical protein